MTNCCSVNLDDYESASVHKAKVTKARVTHVCNECKEQIEPGRLYERVHCYYGSRWITYATCARCTNVRDEYFKNGWVYGHVVDDFRECFDFDYRDGIPEDFTPCGASNG